MTDADSAGNRLSYVDSNGNVRNRRVSPVAVRPGQGPLTEPTAVTQAWRRELVFMPQSGPPRDYADAALSARLR